MITIRKGDSFTLTETVSGLASLAGYSAKLYIYTRDRDIIDEISGSIAGLEITYNGLHADTLSYETGNHRYETKIWDATHVFTLSCGSFIVEKTITTSPS